MTKSIFCNIFPSVHLIRWSYFTSGQSTNCLPVHLSNHQIWFFKSKSWYSIHLAKQNQRIFCNSFSSAHLINQNKMNLCNSFNWFFYVQYPLKKLRKSAFSTFQPLNQGPNYRYYGIYLIFLTFRLFNLLMRDSNYRFHWIYWNFKESFRT